MRDGVTVRSLLKPRVRWLSSRSPVLARPELGWWARDDTVLGPRYRRVERGVGSCDQQLQFLEAHSGCRILSLRSNRRELRRDRSWWRVHMTSTSSPPYVGESPWSSPRRAAEWSSSSSILEKSLTCRRQGCRGRREPGRPGSRRRVSERRDRYHPALPDLEILSVLLDEKDTRVLRSGFWPPEHPTRRRSGSGSPGVAVNRVEKAARDEDILNLVKQNAENVIRAFVISLGFKVNRFAR